MASANPNNPIIPIPVQHAPAPAPPLNHDAIVAEAFNDVQRCSRLITNLDAQTEALTAQRSVRFIHPTHEDVTSLRAREQDLFYNGYQAKRNGLKEKLFLQYKNLIDPEANNKIRKEFKDLEWSRQIFDDSPQQQPLLMKARHHCVVRHFGKRHPGDITTMKSLVYPTLPSHNSVDGCLAALNDVVVASPLRHYVGIGICSLVPQDQYNRGPKADMVTLDNADEEFTKSIKLLLGDGQKIPVYRDHIITESIGSIDEFVQFQVSDTDTVSLAETVCVSNMNGQHVLFDLGRSQAPRKALLDLLHDPTIVKVVANIEDINVSLSQTLLTPPDQFNQESIIDLNQQFYYRNHSDPKAPTYLDEFSNNVRLPQPLPSGPALLQGAHTYFHANGYPSLDGRSFLVHNSYYGEPEPTKNNVFIHRVDGPAYNIARFRSLMALDLASAYLASNVRMRSKAPDPYTVTSLTTVGDQVSIPNTLLNYAYDDHIAPPSAWRCQYDVPCVQPFIELPSDPKIFQKRLDENNKRRAELVQRYTDLKEEHRLAIARRDAQRSNKSRPAPTELDHESSRRRTDSTSDRSRHRSSSRPHRDSRDSSRNRRPPSSHRQSQPSAAAAASSQVQGQQRQQPNPPKQSILKQAQRVAPTVPTPLVTASAVVNPLSIEFAQATSLIHDQPPVPALAASGSSTKPKYSTVTAPVPMDTEQAQQMLLLQRSVWPRSFEFYAPLTENDVRELAKHVWTNYMYVDDLITGFPTDPSPAARLAPIPLIDIHRRIYADFLRTDAVEATLLHNWLTEFRLAYKALCCMRPFACCQQLFSALACQAIRFAHHLCTTMSCHPAFQDCPQRLASLLLEFYLVVARSTIMPTFEEHCALRNENQPTPRPNNRVVCADIVSSDDGSRYIIRQYGCWTRPHSFVPLPMEPQYIEYAPFWTLQISHPQLGFIPFARSINIPAMFDFYSTGKFLHDEIFSGTHPVDSYIAAIYTPPQFIRSFFPDPVNPNDPQSMTLVSDMACHSNYFEPPSAMQPASGSLSSRTTSMRSLENEFVSRQSAGEEGTETFAAQDLPMDLSDITIDPLNPHIPLAPIDNSTITVFLDDPLTMSTIFTDLCPSRIETNININAHECVVQTVDADSGVVISEQRSAIVPDPVPGQLVQNMEEGENQEIPQQPQQQQHQENENQAIDDDQQNTSHDSASANASASSKSVSKKSGRKASVNPRRRRK